MVLGGLICYDPAHATKIVIQTPEKFADGIKAASLIIPTNDKDDITPQDLLAAARADYSRIIGAMYEEGYYAPVVNILVDGQEAAAIPLLASPSRIDRITIRVLPGEKFRFSKAVATPITRKTELPKGFAKGKTARSGLIQKAGEAGIEGWRNKGHAKVRIAGQRYAADHRAHTLSAEILYDPGPELRFGDLRIMSQSAVRAERIAAIAGLPTGKIYSPEKLQLVSERLRKSGAFSSISLRDADAASPDGTLDIEATVVDEKPRRIGGGVEVYSQDGVTLSAFWLHRNLLGGAERLRIEGEVSGISGKTSGMDYKGLIRFERPATLNPDTDLYLQASLESLDEPNYKQDNALIGGGFIHRFSKDLTGEIGLAYRYSKIDDEFGKRKAHLLMLPARLTWDTRDSDLNATRGHFIDATATPFMGLDKSIYGGRLFADARIFRPATDWLVLAGRLQAGSVMGAKARDVPPDMLFFSGGSGTVRGHKYLAMGVDVPGDDDVGGRAFLGLSGEARFKIKSSYGAVVFADAGYVSADSLGGGESDWQGGAGLGFRYYTPVGPIRVDLATPIDRAGRRYELYIGIGQAF